MSKNKTLERKEKLAMAIKQNRRIPLFVIAKTARKITSNSKKRSWRQRKMKIKV